LGGFHLAGPTEAIILETVDALEAFDLQLILVSSAVGKRLVL
jgi:metal-dependent hydrolase (beta-lactamase superfamily II)